jgi:hypothetical protein
MQGRNIPTRWREVHVWQDFRGWAVDQVDDGGASLRACGLSLIDAVNLGRRIAAELDCNLLVAP